MFYVPNSPRAYNLFHNGNYVTEASTIFLRDAKSDAKMIPAMGKSIQRAAGIDHEPAFSQSIISEHWEFHQFEEYVIVFRVSDRSSWEEIRNSNPNALPFQPGNPPLETVEDTRKRANA